MDLSKPQVMFIMVMEILSDDLLIETRDGLVALMDKYPDVGEEVKASDKFIIGLIEKEIARRKK